VTDTTVTQPVAVDSDGNILAHARAGVNLALVFKDAAGDLIDVSASVLYFEVKDKLRVALAAGDVASQRRLQLTQAQVAAMGTSGPLFVIRDETAAIPLVKWEGRFTVRGFTAQPPT